MKFLRHPHFFTFVFLCLTARPVPSSVWIPVFLAEPFADAADGQQVLYCSVPAPHNGPYPTSAIGLRPERARMTSIRPISLLCAFSFNHTGFGSSMHFLTCSQTVNLRNSFIDFYRFYVVQPAERFVPHPVRFPVMVSA